MQRPMRRQERQMEPQQAHKLLEECEYAVLTTVDPEGEPHSVPISRWWKGTGSISTAPTRGKSWTTSGKSPGEACAP